MKQVLLFLLLVPIYGYSQCQPPSQIDVINTLQGFDISWNSEGGADQYEVVILPHETSPNGNETGIITSSNFMSFDNFECGTYGIYVRSYCSGEPSNWSTQSGPAIVLNPAPEFTGSITLSACDFDQDGFAVFDLSQATEIIQNQTSVSNSDFAVAYFTSLQEAFYLSSPIAHNSMYFNQAENQTLYAMYGNWVTDCFWIVEVQLEVYSCGGLHLISFLDLNNNGTMEGNESLFPYATFSYSLNNASAVSTATSTGEYFIEDIDQANTYVISTAIQDFYDAYLTVMPSSVTANAGPGVQEIHFAVTATQPFSDLTTTIIPYSSTQPGFNYSNKVVYSNFGTSSQSGILTFTKDTNVSFISMPTGAVATASGFTLAFSNLLPFETREFTVMMNVPTIPTVSLGQMLTNSVSITVPANDILPANNTYSLTQTIVGSYDPNDKVEAHGGPIVLEQFSPDEELVYTIRFENTGTAAASFITVEDELDAQLDAGTLRMISASHDYVLTKNGQNLSWFFDEVNLPPTVQDPIGSHGYITFAVKPHSGLQVGDIIPNTAAIFFDFNPAIITNTFETEFMAPLSTPGFNDLTFTIHPNPASETVQINASGMAKWVTVTDMTGKIVMESVPSEQNPDVNIAKLQSGLYLMQVTLEDGTRSMQKLIKK